MAAHTRIHAINARRFEFTEEGWIRLGRRDRKGNVWLMAGVLPGEEEPAGAPKATPDAAEPHLWTQQVGSKTKRAPDRVRSRRPCRPAQGREVVALRGLDDPLSTEDRVSVKAIRARVRCESTAPTRSITSRSLGSCGARKRGLRCGAVFCRGHPAPASTQEALARETLLGIGRTLGTSQAKQPSLTKVLMLRLLKIDQTGREGKSRCSAEPS